ncbi:MAG: hypothetical protein K6F85_03405 [Bacteroidales bacterium]|nr:hypothetical protein [Bacteroidales bacterium]
MLKLFRTNTVMQLAIIVATVALLWTKAIINPVAMPEVDGYAPLYSLIYGWLAAAPRAAVVIALVIVVVSAILFNYILTDVQLVSNNTLLPAELYIVAMSVCPHGLTLTPMVLVGFILVISSNQLMLRSTLLTIPPEKTFGVMALVGVCTMIYVPALSLVASFLLVVIIYRLYNWRDWTVMVLGFLAPYILLTTYLFVTDGLAEAWNELAVEVGRFGLRVSPVSLQGALANGYLILLLVVALFGAIGIVNERTVVIQKNAIAISLLMLAGAIMLCYSQVFPLDMQLMALPFSLQATLFLQNMEHSKRPWIWDVVLALAIAAAFVYNIVT